MDNKVIIVVEANHYKVSKSKLVESSSYFNSMFNGDFLEKNKSTISLKGITINSWERILYFLENGKLRPETYSNTLYRDTLDLLEATTMLQFTDMQERCIRSLYQSLDVFNALEILQVASKLDINILIKNARAIVLWNSDIITNCDAFFELNADQVEGYLSDPALHSTSGEWGVWEAMVRWINSSSNFHISRREFLPRLIKCISLQKITLSDLQTISLHEYIVSNKLISEVLDIILAEKAREIPIRQYTGFLIKDETLHCNSGNPVPLRFENDKEEVSEPEVTEFIRVWRSMPERKLPLVPALVANMNSGPTVGSPYVIRYSEEEQRFIPVLRLDKVETSLGALVGFKVISHGSKLYMLGGEILTRQDSWYYGVWEYDQISGKWLFLANLRKKTRHSSACVIGDDLYVLGGFGRHRVIQDSVCKLSITEKNWTYCAPLPRPMYSVPCCAFKGNIYVIQTQIYQYTPERCAWDTLDIVLPPGKVFVAAVANDNFIYIVGICGTVYMFDPSKAEKEVLMVGKFRFECSQVCLIDDYIFSFSQDEFFLEIYCEKMNIISGCCTMLCNGMAPGEIETLNQSHRHGCFPLLCY